MTISEIYSLLVLEAGIDPGYVLDRMEFYEIDALIDHFYLSHKEGWEQARMISYVIAQSNSTKKIRPTDLIQFPWDKMELESTDKAISTKDIERLKKKAEQYIKSK